jgi:hypothetical protein
MNGMIVFVLFLAFLFGAGMLALVAGFMDVEKRRLQEKKRSEAEALRAVPTVASEPRFFARLDANPL